AVSGTTKVTSYVKSFPFPNRLVVFHREVRVRVFHDGELLRDVKSESILTSQYRAHKDVTSRLAAERPSSAAAAALRAMMSGGTRIAAAVCCSDLFGGPFRTERVYFPSTLNGGCSFHNLSKRSFRFCKAPTALSNRPRMSLPSWV